MLRDFLPIVEDHPNPWRRLLSKFDILGLFSKDPFGNSMLLKRFMILIVGSITYWKLNVANRMKVEGVEHIGNLPPNNVFFISNYQTYFADVLSFFHIFCAVKWGFKNINYPVYLFAPRVRMFYVAAKETMQSGIVPKIFATGGALTVERSWRAEGQNVQRTLDTSAGDKMAIALKWGWVVSFQQSITLKPMACNSSIIAFGVGNLPEWNFQQP